MTEASVMYEDHVQDVLNLTDGEPHAVRVAAVVGENGVAILVGDLDLDPGQARVLLAKVASALAHADHLYRQGTS